MLRIRFNIILMALLAVLAVGLWYSFFRTPKITGLEVAIKTSSFLDKTFQTDGSMISGFVCQMGTGICNPMVVNANRPDLSEVINGYYELAKASGDGSYRAKSDQIIDFVLNECRTNFHMCDWNISPIVGYYLDTKDKKYLDAIFSSAKKLLVLSNQDLIDQNAGNGIALLYQATGDERYKKRLSEAADEELLNWPRSQEQFEYSIRVIWSIFIPAYAGTKDQKYLAASEQFFDNFNLRENFDLNRLSLESIIKGTDALMNLSEMSDHGAVYKTQAHAVLQEALNQSWDSPENLKLNGDYGFGYATTKYNNYVKKFLYNGWLIKLFAMMADEKFNLPVK